ncbi:alpha/beta hydrolase [Enterobacter sp.]|uniref:alpha/beta hydrolase n=1 Tax=Enterobacter sp. TaxID=42895 RepID=UPI00296E5293|nr:alpha/beta hydrolase [Enterobacter sp.]
MSKRRRVILLVTILLMLGYCTASLSRIALSLFYHPDKENFASMPTSAELVQFRAKDGTQLTGWFIPAENASPKEAAGTVIHAHGNGGNVTHYWPFVSWLPARNFNVFMFDYRGYGASEGDPSPEGLCDDTQSAIEYVRKRQDIDPQRLLLLGQSLGGNNIVAAVGRGDRSGINAIALDSTFFSYSAIASDKVPGAGILLDDTYSASRYIAGLSPIPLLFFHGTNDAMIPWQHSERLFAEAKAPRQKIMIDGGRHIDALLPVHNDRYRNALVDFYLHALEQKK